MFVCVDRIDEQHVVNLPGIPPFGKAGGLYPFLRNGKLRKVDDVHTPARFPCRRAQRKVAFARADAGRVSPMHWCFRKTGGFDEAYWPYGWEDDDYMMRLAEIRIPTALVKDFTFKHRSSPSSEIRDTAEKNENDARNQARFTDRWHLRRLDKESPDFRFPGMVEI